MCNTASNVLAESQSGGVKSAAAATAPFTNIINYTGAATLGSATSTINTADGRDRLRCRGRQHRRDRRRRTRAASPSRSRRSRVGRRPLVAGSYSDVLRVTMTPSVNRRTACTAPRSRSGPPALRDPILRHRGKE